VQALIPHFRGVFEVLALQGLELFRREFELRHGRIGRWLQATEIHGLQMLHGLTPAFAQVLLKACAHLGPKIRRGCAHLFSPESVIFLKSLVPSIFQFVVT
jgi:hypothetical protein